MDQRFAFMLGSGRCGSTIVGQVVAMHPDVGFIANVDDRLAGFNRKGRLNNRIYRSLPAPLQKQGGRRGGGGHGRLTAGVRSVAMTPSEGYRLLDRHVSPMLSKPCRDLVAEDASAWLSDRLRAFFEQRADAQGRSLFLHKFTGWPRAGLLHAVFPEARFVLDVAHVWTLDPTLELGFQLLECYGDRLSHLHVSGIEADGQHRPTLPSDLERYAPLLERCRDLVWVLETQLTDT